MRFSVWGVLALILILAAPLTQVQAGGVVGNGTPSSCTQEALQSRLNSGGLVTFNCGSSPHTINITSPRIISATTTIDGNGRITLNGSNQSIILKINSNVPLLTVQNLRFINAKNTDSNTQINGGAISAYYKSNLTVINSTFENNVTDSPYVDANRNLDFGGGAIYLHTGLLIVRNSTFKNNRSIDGAGGAIHTLHSNVDITDSTFENNQATGYGGAFYNDGVLSATGSVIFRRNSFIGNTGNGQGGAAFVYLYARYPNSTITIDSSRFINNRLGLDEVNHSFGGGLRLGSGTVLVKDSVFSGNSAVLQGGAIWSGESGAITLDNVTISGNRVTDPSNSYGGGIKVSNSRGFTIKNSTIVNNSAGEVGGGLFDGPATLRNTIIAFNTAANGNNSRQNCSQPYVNGGGNLQSSRLGTNDPLCTAGITLGNPQLGPLTRNNGGLTETHALLPGSPGVDLGDNRYCSAADQRGVLRPFDGNGDGIARCDSGAYELVSFGANTAAGSAPYVNAFNTQSPTLTWSRVTTAASYVLEIDNNSDFSSVNFRYENIATPSFRVPDALPISVWHWRVRVKNSDGSLGGWSAADSFVVHTS